MVKEEGKKKVTGRSSRQDIWEAYNELLAEVEGKKISGADEVGKPEAAKASGNLAELKTKITQSLDELAEKYAGELENFEEFKEGVEKERRRILGLSQEQKEMLENEISRVKASWNQIKEQKAVEREREGEDFRYELKKSRRQEADEFEAKKQAREETIREKEEAIEARGKEIEQMERELKEWPATAEKMIKEAKDLLIKEFTGKHAIEIRELKTARESEANLSKVKIANCEQMISRQAAEINTLRAELAEAQKHLKEISVSALDGRACKSPQNPGDQSS